MAGQLNTVHALITAFSNNGSSPGVLQAVKAAVVPLERAMTAVQTTLPDVADSRTLHAIRKEVMREMDPVARTVQHREMIQRSKLASIFRNDPFASDKYEEKVVQYSGHPPFPTRQQRKMLIKQAVAEKVPEEMRKRVEGQIAALFRSGEVHLHRDCVFDLDYNGERHKFATNYLPAQALCDTPNLRPACGAWDLNPAERTKYFAPAAARIVELTTRAQQLRPPTGDELAAAVQRACGQPFSDDERRRLSQALSLAVAPHRHGSAGRARIGRRRPSEGKQLPRYEREG